MIKYICDKCQDSFVKDGIKQISNTVIEADLCGKCFKELIAVVDEWMRAK